MVITYVVVRIYFFCEAIYGTPLLSVALCVLYSFLPYLFITVII